MTNSNQQWFVTERTRTLALVQLTRRDDLAISNGPAEVGLDLLVSIKKAAGERSLRQFGVVLRGNKDAIPQPQLSRILRPTIQALLQVGEFPYPVVLFHFAMQDDQGRFTWVAEPAIEDQGPRLLMHREVHLHQLDREALDEIVTRVDRWYDAFFGRIALTVA